MGTLVSITAVASTDQAANRSIDPGFKEVKRLEQLLSTWIPESEMSRVNALAGKTPVPVGLETLTVVQHAVQAAEMTGGGFNVMMWGSHALKTRYGVTISVETIFVSLDRPLLPSNDSHHD
ncbi:MAG: FAD:protein FMN transferase [Nitrospira sp. BO4]|jgi:thiamine biosynthesis lipoprotein|nr:FAD:protein FMN transferase [Nitrospira sp. BO4]